MAVEALPANVVEFFRHLDVFGKPLSCTVWRLDEELSEYVEELWAAGDGLAQAECTLGALSCVGAFQALGKS